MRGASRHSWRCRRHTRGSTVDKRLVWTLARWIGLSGSLLACGGAAGRGYEGHVASTSSPSSPSSTSSPYGEEGLRWPSAQAPAKRGVPPAASIVVRPDVLDVDFAVSAVVDDAGLGARIVNDATKALEARFAEVAPKGALQIRMRATNIEPAPHAPGKIVARKDTKRDAHDARAPAPVSVTVEGRVFVALAPAQDYWERTHLVARLTALVDQLAANANADPPRFAIVFGRIEPHVRAPEAARAELAQRWATQRKQAAREVQAGDAALAREVCAPAAQVVERVASLEEIELTLPIECRRLD